MFNYYDMQRIVKHTFMSYCSMHTCAYIMGVINKSREKSTLRQIPAPPTTLRKLKPFCQKPGCDVVDTLPWNLAFCAKQNFGQILEGKLVGRRARARDDCQ
jgi:hypothetical protein